MSLSIDAPKEDIEQPTTARKEGCDGTIPNDGSTLWYPQLPDPSLLLLSVANRKTRAYPHLLYSICLFGGTDGQFLPYLAEISVWVNDRSDLRCGYFSISAIAFHFSKLVDGTNSMLLGQIPQSRIEGVQRHKFTIDSLSGERINGVDATYAGHGNMIVAITVSEVPNSAFQVLMQPSSTQTMVEPSRSTHAQERILAPFSATRLFQNSCVRREGLLWDFTQCWQVPLHLYNPSEAFKPRLKLTNFQKRDTWLQTLGIACSMSNDSGACDMNKQSMIVRALQAVSFRLHRY